MYLNFAGEVTIFCTGPLTNIALAIRIYPQFVRDVKQIYVLGGSVYSKQFPLINVDTYLVTGVITVPTLNLIDASLMH